MNVFDEAAFRLLIRQELRQAIREELGERVPAADAPLVTIKRAAAAAAVSPATIRMFLRTGRIQAYGSGRLLRVRLAEVLAAMRADAAGRDRPAISPEEEADRFLEERQRARDEGPHSRRTR